MKKNIISGILFCLMTALSLHTAFADVPEEMPLTSAGSELNSAMKKLWEDHLVYTRNYIISDLGNLGDKSKIAQRLLENQADIGDAIKPFYGEAAGNKLTALLKEHIMIATKVVDAAKKNHPKSLKKASADWKRNGDDIATFLSNANPNWKKSDMQHMLGMHLELTTAEVVARLKKDWAADIAAYDAGHVHMFMFADELSRGIARQFPEQFRDLTTMHASNEAKESKEAKETKEL